MDIKRQRQQQKLRGKRKWDGIVCCCVAFNKVLNTIIALTHEFEDEWHFILHGDGQLITRLFLRPLRIAKQNCGPRSECSFNKVPRTRTWQLPEVKSANTWYIFTILCQLTCTNFSLSSSKNLFQVNFCSLEIITFIFMFFAFSLWTKLTESFNQHFLRWFNKVEKVNLAWFQSAIKQ